MASLLPKPGGPTELSDAPSPSPSPSSTSASAPSSAATSSSSPSLLSKVKRGLSTRKNSFKEHLPNRLLLRRESKNGGSGGEDVSTASALPPGEGGPLETQGEGTLDHPRAYTIAPPDHRQNTTLRAVTDSFPLLSSLHAPSLSFNLPTFSSSPFSSSSSRTSSPSIPCFTADGYDDSEDDSPAASPPMSRRNSPPSLSSPPLSSPRRSFDPCPSSSSKISDDPLERLYGNVVQLGGFRGSTLRDAKTGKRLWIPLRVGFGFRQADLGLGLEDEDELRSTETVVPGNMLCAIGGVVDLGKKLKAKLKSIQASQSPPTSHPSFPFTSSASPPAPPDPLRPPLHFHSFGYDWRRRLELSSAELLSLLERLKEESAARGEGEGGRGVGATVIAHSMGGLVVMHALAKARDPTIFRGIVFAGTPFQGCVNILGALKLGGAVPRNPKTGDPATVLSWRSCYYFLPRPPAVVAPGPSKEGEAKEEKSKESGEGKKEFEERPKASLSALPPAVGETTSPYPTPPLTPTPLTSSPTPRSASSSSTASSRSSTSRSSPPSPAPQNSSKPQLAPLPPSTHLNPSSHLPPLSTLLSGCFETPAGTPIPVDFFDPESYSRYALSPAVAGMNLGRDRSAAAGAKEGKVGEKQHPRQEQQQLQKEKEDDSALPIVGGPGNLGEGGVFGLDRTTSSPLEAAASGVERLQAELDNLTFRTGEEEREAEGRLREEEERLKKQVGEEETVRGYLGRCLSRAQKFHEEIITLYDPTKASQGLYPPISVLTSRSTPTARGILSSSREKIAEEGYDRLLWAEGDGIVLYETATRLPGDPEVRGGKRGEGDDKWQGLLKGIVETQNGHVSMLADLDSVRECVRLLYG